MGQGQRRQPGKRLALLLEEHQEGAQQDQNEEDNEKDEAVARYTLLVAQRPKSLDAAGGEVAHQLRFRCR